MTKNRSNPISRFLVLSSAILAATFSAFGEPLRFAAIGDFGSDSDGEVQVARLVKKWAPAFIITLGDNSYSNNDGNFLSRDVGKYYGDFITSDLATNRFWPSLGNHDVDGPDRGSNYLGFFTLPQTPGQEWYYEFARGPVRFFVLNSATSREGHGRRFTGGQGRWLKSALAAAKEPIKLVYFHHPPFSSGEEHGSDSEMWWPFKDWGATAVLAGHEHNYEHIVKRGFHYFVNGVGGAGIYDKWKTPKVAGSVRRYPDPALGEVSDARHGAMLIEADETQVILRFITAGKDGGEKEIDRVTILAGEPQNVPPIFRTMRRRMKGTDIEAWQEFLISKGFNLTTPDGEYGNKTHHATVAFQAANNIPASEAVDGATLAKAKELSFEPVEFEGEFGNGL